MSDSGRYFCPRLLDYLVIAGCRNPSGSNHVSETPELLRRYPLEDHNDFPLPNDVIFFCQPEGCMSVGPKSMSLREISSFVFTLTEKDSGLVRYGICINFYRPFEKRAHPSEPWPKIDKPSTGSGHSFEVLNSLECERGRSPNKARKKTRVRNNTLTSLCVVSHHPFFSTFRECLFVLQRLIEACHDRSCVKRVGGSKVAARDSVWGVLTGQISDNISSLIVHEVREIETWILRLLSAPVPVPGKTRVEVHILPKELQQPLLFALPDNTRFGLVDFPLHLPLELLGVETCLRALSAIILEHKVILQSRDYNALTMSVMAFVSMLYPLEYMFPIIPLLPTCMASAEQLLMAPTPYLIGVPASFFGYKKGFPLPDDVWLVDLDANKMLAPSTAEPLPPLPEPEGTILKTHLRQALASMSMTPHPIKDLDAVAPYSELWQRKDNLSSGTGFNPLIYGNDVDSVDVATRVAMIRFFNSSNILGNFAEHTRTLRLYPRPVVAFQLYSFLKSRPEKTAFTFKLARTQAVEYFSEWSLCPTNMVYQRVQTGVYDPSLIGDKPKWYAQQLQPVEFHVYDNSSSLGAAISSLMEKKSDDNPTDESGSDSDGAESNSSSYSSLSDFVSDLFNSDIRGETPMFAPEMQILAVDEAQVYSPPCRLMLPDMDITNSSSPGNLHQDIDNSSSASPKLSSSLERNDKQEETVFRYDSGNMIDLTRSNTSVTTDQIQPGSPAGLSISPRSHVSSPSIYSQSPKTPPVQSGCSSPHVIPPPVNKSLSVNSGVRSPKDSLSSNSSTPTRKHGKNFFDNEKSQFSSTIFSISGELAEMATNTVSELFGGSKSQPTSPHTKMSSAKPFSPLGHRKALVEKSGLAKHAANRRLKEPQRMASIENRASSNSENQQFLMDVIKSVLDGKGLGWTKSGRYHKLMEDENYRNFVVSRLNQNMDNKVPEDAAHIDDVCVYKPVLKGMLTLIKGIIRGLGHAINNHGLGGMASAYMILEIAHTHYWARDLSIKSDGCITPEKTSLHGSHDSLEPPNFRRSDDDTASDWWPRRQGSDSQSSSALTSPRTPPPPSYGTGAPTTTNAVFAESIDLLSPHTDLGSPVTTDSENVDITSVSDDGGSGGSGRGQFHTGQHPRNKQQQTNNGSNQCQVVEGRGDTSMPSVEWDVGQQLQQPGLVTCDITVTDAVPDSQGQSDMLREMVRNKELIRAGRMERKFNSEDSEMSEASTLISTKSEREGSGRRKYNIHHDSIRSALSDSEMETNWPAGSHSRRRGSSSVWNTKSTFSSGYRYHEGKLIHTGVAGLTAESAKSRTYLFEGLVGKDRSHIWDNMQFWEDVFLDSVSQERDMIGMDQRPSEMMERYSSLSDVEKKKLEYDEDKLLSGMLYNQAAFMLMMRVPKIEIKKKIRRLLGKSHIGLQQSQDINNLLDNIQQLHGNDIDLKPLRGRPVQKLSFTVHWGVDNTGDMLFMEVCDDSLILRNVTGAIHDRWWFEKLVNMAYCSDTKVFCLCRMKQNEVEINRFYTKKCSELYDATQKAMGKAAKGTPLSLSETKQSPNVGEYPVQDLKKNESGILKVCLEGISLLLQNSQLFIELSKIQKCSTQKGGIFVLEEFDRKTKKVIEHKFKSDMADDICKAVLGKITYVIQTVGVDQRKQS